MKSCSLIIDTRERNVLRHEIELTCPHRVEQITTADYVVLSPAGAIIAVIERKSYDDFAASFKDGRAENLCKLIKMQQHTGCRIIYLLEGPEFPHPDQYFGNIAYKNIESAMFHLQMRDNVQIIRTRDTLHTAQTLSRFVISMNSLANKHDLESPLHMPERDINELLDQGADVSDVIKELTKKHTLSVHEQVRTLWACFKGITTETADDYSKLFSIREIIGGTIPRATLTNITLASGKKIGKRQLDSLICIPRQTEVKLLSSIDGVSAAAANKILSECSLKQLLSYGEAGIAMQTGSAKGRKLGPAAAKRIIDLMNYKYVKDNIPIVAEIPQPQMQMLPTAEIALTGTAPLEVGADIIPITERYVATEAVAMPVPAKTRKPRAKKVVDPDAPKPVRKPRAKKTVSVTTETAITTE